MGPGDLRDRITLLRVSESKTAGGDRVAAIHEVASVWAARHEVAVQEFNAGTLEGNKRRITFTVRWRRDLSADMRVRFESVEYRLVKILEVDRRRYVQLMVEADV